MPLRSQLLISSSSLSLVQRSTLLVVLAACCGLSVRMGGTMAVQHLSESELEPQHEQEPELRFVLVD